MRTRRLGVHRDDRGVLIAVDTEDLGFEIRRVFVVSEVPDGVTRGDHVVPCRQTMVLTGGRAEVVLQPPGGPATEVVLSEIGDAVDLHPGEFVSYRVSRGGSVMVFAAERYRPHPSAGSH